MVHAVVAKSSLLRYVRVAMLLVWVAGCSPLGWLVHEQSEWDVRGVIVAASATEVRVRHKSGRVLAFTLASDTTLNEGGHQVALGHLQRKRRVHVRASEQGGVLVATQLTLF